MENNQEANEIHLRRAALGDEAHEFLNTQVGQYIVACAEVEIAEAVEKLKKCEPEATIEIRRLQNKILVAESIVGWLMDAISAGLQSLQILEDRGDEHGN